jgi:hypothetical protein
MSNIPPAIGCPSFRNNQYGGTETFKGELKNKTEAQLTNMLTDPKLSPAQKQAVKAELLERFNQRHLSPDASDKTQRNDADRLNELLSKLMAGEDLSSSEEGVLKKLLKALGLSDEEIDKMLAGVKDAKDAKHNPQSSPGASTEGDITGG